jgi:hypothetical protein
MQLKKFQVLNFLNGLAGGDLSDPHLYDQSISFSAPDFILSGESERVVSELRKMEVFRLAANQSLEIRRYLEGSHFVLVEAGLPQAEKTLSCAFLLEFSESKMKKIKAYYPTLKSLSMADECMEGPSLNLPKDVSDFFELLATNQQKAIEDCFERTISIQNHEGGPIVGAVTLEPFRYLEGNQFCLTEVYWGSEKCLVFLGRARNGKFESCQIFGKVAKQTRPSRSKSLGVERSPSDQIG